MSDNNILCNPALLLLFLSFEKDFHCVGLADLEQDVVELRELPALVPKGWG